MPRSVVHYFTEDISFNLKHKTIIKNWLKAAIAEEDYFLSELNFIFCSDEYLLGINQQFLKHDTYTDVITFDNSEVFKLLVSDIYISVERIKENAVSMKSDFMDELCRVMIHGILHLMGYKDKTPANKAEMTKKEDYYLAKLSF